MSGLFDRKVRSRSSGRLSKRPWRIARHAHHEAALRFIPEERGDRANRQRADHAVGNGFEHFVEVRFGAEFAGEFDERAAIVVAVFVEVVAVEQFLEPVPDGLKDEDRDQQQDDERRSGEFADFTQREQDAEEDREHRERGHRVDKALLEDDVDIHQAIAEDGVRPHQGHQKAGLVPSASSGASARPRRRREERRRR